MNILAQSCQLPQASEILLNGNSKEEAKKLKEYGEVLADIDSYEASYKQSEDALALSRDERFRTFPKATHDLKVRLTENAAVPLSIVSGAAISGIVSYCAFNNSFAALCYEKLPAVVSLVGVMGVIGGAFLAGIAATAYAVSKLYIPGAVDSRLKAEISYDMDQSRKQLKKLKDRRRIYESTLKFEQPARQKGADSSGTVVEEKDFVDINGVRLDKKFGLFRMRKSG